MEKDIHINSMKNEAPLQNLSDFDNKSLLIVDDDNPFRERLARAMEKKGFEVIQAEDGIRDVERSRGLGDVYKRQSLYNRQVFPVSVDLLILQLT